MSKWDNEEDKATYYRGLNNYQQNPLLQLQYNGPQNPILIIRLPILHPPIIPLIVTLVGPFLRNPFKGNPILIIKAPISGYGYPNLSALSSPKLKP